MSDFKEKKNKIEKPIYEQIMSKMISKLKDSEHFTDSILTELERIDLKNKSKVQEAISKQVNDSPIEDI